AHLDDTAWAVVQDQARINLRIRRVVPAIGQAGLPHALGVDRSVAAELGEETLVIIGSPSAEAIQLFALAKVDAVRSHLREGNPLLSVRRTRRRRPYRCAGVARGTHHVAQNRDSSNQGASRVSQTV